MQTKSNTGKLFNRVIGHSRILVQNMDTENDSENLIEPLPVSHARYYRAKQRETLTNAQHSRVGEIVYARSQLCIPSVDNFHNIHSVYFYIYFPQTIHIPFIPSF